MQSRSICSVTADSQDGMRQKNMIYTLLLIFLPRIILTILRKTLAFFLRG